MELDQIITATLENEGGTLAIAHKPREADGAPPWRIILSYAGPDHPVRPTSARAVYGYGQTMVEALEQLTEALRAEED